MPFGGPSDDHPWHCPEKEQALKGKTGRTGEEGQTASFQRHHPIVVIFVPSKTFDEIHLN